MKTVILVYFYVRYVETILIQTNLSVSVLPKHQIRGNSETVRNAPLGMSETGVPGRTLISVFCPPRSSLQVTTRFESIGFSLSGLTVYHKVCGLGLDSHIKHDSIPIPCSNSKCFHHQLHQAILGKKRGNPPSIFHCPYLDHRC